MPPSLPPFLLLFFFNLSAQCVLGIILGADITSVAKLADILVDLIMYIK